MKEPFTLTSENVGEVINNLLTKLEEPRPGFELTEDWARICGWSEEAIEIAKASGWIISKTK